MYQEKIAMHKIRSYLHWVEKEKFQYVENGEKYEIEEYINENNIKFYVIDNGIDICAAFSTNSYPEIELIHTMTFVTWLNKFYINFNMFDDVLLHKYLTYQNEVLEKLIKRQNKDS